MNPDQALKYLAQICLEYAQTAFKGMPATQEAILLQVQLAHNTLNSALTALPTVPADGDPAA